MIWTGIATGFTMMIVSLYPSFKDMGVEMAKVIPKEMAKAFNMDTGGWQEISGYYKTYFGFHIIIILTITLFLVTIVVLLRTKSLCCMKMVQEMKTQQLRIMRQIRLLPTVRIHIPQILYRGHITVITTDMTE